MRIKNDLELREVCGEHLVVATGIENIDFNKMLHLNDSAKLLWDSVRNIDFTAETMAHILCEEYDITADVALHDAQQLIDCWKEQGIIEDKLIFICPRKKNIHRKNTKPL